MNPSQVTGPAETRPPSPAALADGTPAYGGSALWRTGT